MHSRVLLPGGPPPVWAEFGTVGDLIALLTLSNADIAKTVLPLQRRRARLDRDARARSETPTS